MNGTLHLAQRMPPNSFYKRQPTLPCLKRSHVVLHLFGLPELPPARISEPFYLIILFVSSHGGILWLVKYVKLSM